MRVRIADDFFKKERDQAYADWQSSFWRELFQNAIDQNASEIRIDIRESDGCVSIKFSDNGPGMTREVLENVYFNIGATTKTGSDQIGGMGRARILTCFSMKRYRIESDDYIVTGQGGDYEVVDAPFHDGCALHIEAQDTSVAEMTEKLTTFLGECRISARVYLNGVLNTVRSPRLGRHTRDLVANGETFAKVYVNKSNVTNKVIIQVNGVSMYSINTDAKAQVVVELLPSVSRLALTSNRDGLRWRYRDALDSYLRELAVDTNSSLRTRFRSQTNVTRNGGFLKVARPKKPEPKRVVSSEPWVPEVSRTNDYFVNAAQEEADTFVEAAGEKKDAFGKWLASTFGDIFIFDETETAEIHKVVPNYLPENWKPITISGGRTGRKGLTTAKVLLMWKTAIQYTLEVSLDILGLNNTRYGVGFLFVEDRLAEKREMDGGHLFLLRPISKDGKLAYSVRERKSLKRLMTFAKHEVSHISVAWHSETYSAIREQIDEVFDESECLRRMKDALNAMPDFDVQPKRIERWAA